MQKKVMLAMSGGVDSSAAALVLAEQGLDVKGATLIMFDNEKYCPDCAQSKDADDAKQVCDELGLEHFTFSAEAEFEEYVMKSFVDSYKRGETPNPCIECNKHIKFDLLMKKAMDEGCDLLATGHYANICYDEKKGRYILKKALDKAKDQTYVLYGLTQEQLAKTIFPLGNMSKAEIREKAEKHGLSNANKPDSQDICFIEDGDYVGFIERYTKKTTVCGKMKNTDGMVVGEHRGIERYTIGQRKGLGISFGEPVYVVKKDAQANEVIVGKEEALFSKTLVACDCNLISVEKLTGTMRVTAKTRYSQKEQWANLYPAEDGNILVEFDQPQRAITPGQAVVFYDGDIVVGGGTIK